MASKSVKDLLPFREYDSEGCFLMKDGTYMDIHKIICKDLINSEEEDIKLYNMSFNKFYKTYAEDIKIVSMNFPVDTSRQQAYVNHKINTTNNQIYKKFLEIKLLELEYISKNMTEKEYYLFHFAKDIKEYKNQCIAINSILGMSDLVTDLSKEKKIQIIFKLNNKNTSIQV